MPASAPDVVEQRVVEAAGRLPSGGAVSGWAACRLHGAGFFDGLAKDGRTLLPVPVVIGPHGGTRPDPRIVVSRDRLDAAEVVARQGVRCTGEARAVLDAMRWAPDLREAVVAFDMARAGGLIGSAAIGRYVESRGGWFGIGQVRQALPLVSERSRSPAETRLRLLWTLDARLPAPLVNWPVAGPDGRFIAEVDLLDPVAGIVGEYDGADHRSGARHTRDVWREDMLRRVGLEYVTVTGRDMARPDLVVSRICAARDRAALISPQQRTFLIKAVPKRGS